MTGKEPALDAEAPPSRVPERAAQTTAEQPWPVRLLSAKMAQYVERMPSVWVEGQVVQLVHRPGTATAYLTLRDAEVDFSLPVTAPSRLVDALATPELDGARVVVHARPTFWTKRGSVQLSADAIRPVGVGELLARLDQLKRQLAADGLLDPARKRPLPFLPRRVGLVCGRASAAERDVVENARRRWPAVAFVVRCVPVQGPEAVEQVTNALRELEADPDVEVIVVARGGGSLEDLLPFSAEPLLRVVAALRTPVVSAIGHEVDTPLLDLVADVRASTPTDAGKLVVPDVEEQRAAITSVQTRSRRAIRHRLDRERHLLAALRSRPALAEPVSLVDSRRHDVSAVTARGRRALGTHLARSGDHIRHLAAQVRALSPAATMERGYAVVQRTDGFVVRSPDHVSRGDQLRIRVTGGELPAEVS
ncbi:MAG: exodeoxyribonuclease VII large subunit [Angustibacter sp.]